jgi:hypothetical protein
MPRRARIHARTHPSTHHHTEGVGLPLFAHLRVVIRTHPPELLHLRSLIYGLRAAADSRHWLRLDFVLVPTEPGSGVTYDRLQRGVCCVVLCWPYALCGCTSREIEQTRVPTQEEDPPNSLI